jgi:hypothetical protein
MGLTPGIANAIVVVLKPMATDKTIMSFSMIQIS